MLEHIRAAKRSDIARLAELDRKGALPLPLTGQRPDFASGALRLIFDPSASVPASLAMPFVVTVSFPKPSPCGKVFAATPCPAGVSAGKITV